MVRLWEVRGLFGNEYAMENAIDEIRKVGGVEFKVLDRRNLQVLVRHEDEESKKLVRNIIKIAHGFVDGEGPRGEIDRLREKRSQEKLKAEEEKRKRLPKH